MLDTITSFVGITTILFGLKIVLAIILLLYSIFSVMIFVQIRALNRTVSMRSFFSTKFINIFAIFYILASISLFVTTLVIL